MARRTSVFKEVGISAEGDDEIVGGSTARESLKQDVRFNKNRDELETLDEDNDGSKKELRGQGVLPRGESASTTKTRSMMYRFAAGLLLIGAIVSLLQSLGFVGQDAAVPLQGVSGGVVPQEAKAKRDGAALRKRDPTDWCFKWAQQSAIVNGTLYLYGGQIATNVEQTQTLQNTWSNDFISIDLTKDWETGSPGFKALAQPSNVPQVSLGYLWNSYDSLYLYGGEYSWKPPVEPKPFSTWQYDISSSEWVQHSNPTTSAGLNAPDGGVAVQGAAEGAGVNIPLLGRGFYLGGHLDTYTTPGWDITIARVYLKSLLEFTFPGWSNPDVTSLKGNNVAGDGGAYRNITQGGIQDYSFTQRADGILTYIPGYGDQGILVALAGGTNFTFTQMNVINVYDIATSTWYNQATQGGPPDVRVNPCSVIAAASDGSSYNIYMFGGQDLVPYGSQKQKDDMWILTIPAFIWIKVDQGGQSVPPGRSGATCNIWDAQMVMVGGYLGNPNQSQLTCEYPATYVFDLSTLIWQTKFTPLASIAQDDIGKTNFLNQQPLQLTSGDKIGGLEGSYGYAVPPVVYNKIGGNKYGGATITKPQVSATQGPFKTGSPIVYTTETGVPKGFGGQTSSDSGTRTAAIVVGVVCGLALILICYLIFCLFVYRKQLALYKRHVEMSQAEARGEKPPEIPGLWATDSAQYDSDQSKPVNSLRDTGSHVGSNHPSHGGSNVPGTGTNSGQRSGNHSVRRSSEHSSTEDLLADHEPTFVGVMLNPRRSLRVINRD